MLSFSLEVNGGRPIQTSRQALPDRRPQTAMNVSNNNNKINNRVQSAPSSRRRVVPSIVEPDTPRGTSRASTTPRTKGRPEKLMDRLPHVVVATQPRPFSSATATSFSSRSSSSKPQSAGFKSRLSSWKDEK